MNGGSFDQGVKDIKGEFSVEIDISVGLDVDRGVGIGDGNCRDGGITFGFYDGYYSVYSHGSFNSFSVDKNIVRYFNESLE